ncbi:MAG TPA: thymidine phosphorylase, partial [Planctomycetota bacterium]|nr:thymidine phosphorylase [Planctomycetota bacterium]
MDPRDVIRNKRDGGKLSAGEIQAFLDGYVRGEVQDFHASALLMAIFCRGLDAAELLDWTRGMLDSGSKLVWEGLDGKVLDKHSTGGVGDKVSLPLAPALVALGAYVPMISGRGLGHTGGTLDKLEAVPGLKTELTLEALQSQVRSLGLVFGAQTPEIVPADRKLYALRDAAGLVESIPLIASSILSKKLAEGLDALVLDVKYGSGAFLPEVEEGRKLGAAMAQIAQGLGLPMAVVLSSMEAPLGRTVGHAMEVNECLDVLEGEGPQDLIDLTLHLGAEVLVAGGVCDDLDSARSELEAVLTDGSAREIFLRCLRAQGGQLNDRERLAETGSEAQFLAQSEGYLVCQDCRLVGQALMALGGARRVIGGPLDHQVGMEFLVRHGETVRVGQPIARLVHRSGGGLPEAE